MAKTLTIAGVNYLPYYKTNTAKIRETLRKTNVMNLEIVTKGIANAPQEGGELIFKDGSRFLFGGFISRVQPVEIGKGSVFNFDVEVSDYSYIFNSKIVRRAYENETLNDIVTDLMGEYVAASYGFNLTNVDTGPTIDTVSFDHITVKAALDKLAKLTGYVWWVDYELKLYFTTQTATPAPETITDSSNNVDSINISYDTSQVRNSVIIIGSTDGVESADLVAEHFEGDGETRAWELGAKPSTVSSIELNASSEQFSLDLNERDTDVFVYSYAQQSFRLTDAQATPGVGDDIDIEYYPRIPTIEQLTDPASIAFFAALDGGDGVYEMTIRDSSIGSIEEANARALQELEEYSMPLVDGKVTTRSGLLSGGSIFKPGQVLTVNLPTEGLSSDTAFLIQEVRVELRETSASTTEYIYTIRFGGKVVGIQEFLETLAAQQGAGEETADATEILTIEHVVETLEFDDSATPITHSIDTPPYEYGPSGSPMGKWGLSEWN
jgi:hypothetical protein